MLKKEVILRDEIRTVFSSERQERMKVYFELSEQYEQCTEKCSYLPDHSQDNCKRDCEKIFDQYPGILEERYKDGNEERLDMEVANAPIFNTKELRKDRNTMFYKITGYSWEEFWHGKNPQTRKTDVVNDFKRYDSKYAYVPENSQQQQQQQESDI